MCCGSFLKKNVTCYGCNLIFRSCKFLEHSTFLRFQISILGTTTSDKTVQKFITSSRPVNDISSRSVLVDDGWKSSESYCQLSTASLESHDFFRASTVERSKLFHRSLLNLSMQEEEKVAGFADKISSKWQFLLDKSSPHITVRWVTFTCSMYLYLLRVYLVNGWYIVTYGLGIFLLSQSIGFISPQVIMPMFMCRAFTWFYSISFILIHGNWNGGQNW